MKVRSTRIDGVSRPLWLDSPRRYGLISRGFHWLMAALFAWQFAGALLFVTVGDSAVTRFVGGTHLELGFVLFALVLLRGGWGLANWKRRPPHHDRVGRVAAAVHMVIYGLMIVVPGIALLRQSGSGKPFSPFGIPVLPARAEKIDWMIVPGDLLHYWLGFLLLVVVLGHAGMAVLHRLMWKDDLLKRMT
ncbi:cytochrome B [Bosea sp. PAMC 26642]|nr:cytochrome B [Bosea sp. PAMC 26642]